MNLVNRILEILKPSGPSKPESLAETVGYRAGKLAQGSIRNITVVVIGGALGVVVLAYALIRGFRKGIGTRN